MDNKLNQAENEEDLSLSEKVHAFCSAPLDKLFKKFRAGAIYFGVGGIMIYLANVALDASIMQELVMLAGLIMGAYGFVVAMAAQLRMILSRVYVFLFNND